MQARLSAVVLSLVVVLSTGCSTMQPPRYSISVDNIQALKNYADAQIQVSDINQSVNFSAGCRLMGPIEPADGLTIPMFITKAFNDEFKMAGIYSELGNRISGDITHITFSSIDGLTNGNWDIGLSIKSTNGASFSVSNKYIFKSGFDAITACNATADALTPAVQDLINKVVTHQDFKKLL